MAARSCAPRACLAGFIALASLEAQATEPYHLEPFEVTKSRLVKANYECGSNDRFISKANSPEHCGIEAGKKGARYFSYGKVDKSQEGKGLQEMAMKAQNCYIEYTASDECEEGWENNGTYDFYAIDKFQAVPVLLKSGAECRSDDFYIGLKDSAEECAKAVMDKPDGQFFIYGKGFLNKKKCYMEKTKTHDCKEGFSNKDYDYWGIQLTKSESADSNYKKKRSKMVAKGNECASSDDYIGWFMHVDKCEAAVRQAGGKYFSYGQKWGTRMWLCYKENTNSSACPEGFTENSMDFYELGDSAALSDNNNTQGRRLQTNYDMEPFGMNANTITV